MNMFAPSIMVIILTSLLFSNNTLNGTKRPSRAKKKSDTLNANRRLNGRTCYDLAKAYNAAVASNASQETRNQLKQHFLAFFRKAPGEIEPGILSQLAFMFQDVDMKNQQRLDTFKKISDSFRARKYTSSLPFFFSQEAVQYGLLAVMQLIINELADDIDYCYVDGALSMAEQANQSDAVQILVRNKHTSKYFDENMVQQTFRRAVEKNHSAIVRIFITTPIIRKCLTDTTIMCTLNHAAQKGYRDIVQILIPEIKGNAFYFPLKVAVENGRLAVVQLFIDIRHSNNRLPNDHLSQVLQFAQQAEIHSIILNELRRRRCRCYCTIL